MRAGSGRLQDERMVDIATELREFSDRWRTVMWICRESLPAREIHRAARVVTTSLFPGCGPALERLIEGPTWRRSMIDGASATRPEIEMALLASGLPVPATEHAPEWSARVLHVYLTNLRVALHAEVERRFDILADAPAGLSPAPPSGLIVVDAQPARMMNTHAAAAVVERGFEHATALHYQGNADAAFRLLLDLIPLLRVHGRTIPRGLRAEVYRLAGSVQMQRGERDGPLGAVAFAHRAQALFRRLANPFGIARATQLLGLCARQEGAFETAMRLYRDALETASGDVAIRSHIEHDLAVSAFLAASSQRRNDFDEAARLLRDTNAFFSDAEPWFLHADARPESLHLEEACCNDLKGVHGVDCMARTDAAMTSTI